MTSSVIGALSLGAAVFALGLLPLARRWRLPSLAHPDRAALRDWGREIPIQRWEALRGVLIVVGIGVGSVAGTPAVGGLLFGIAPSIVARARAAAAADHARGALGPLLLATHAGLRSGLSLPESLRRAVAGCNDAIARRPFHGALARFDLGDPLDAALAFGAKHTADPRVADAMQTLALGVSERMPVDRAAALLDSVTELVRHDDHLANEVRARSAGIRVQLYLLAAVVPVLSLYLLATMPGLAATLGGVLGRTVLVPAAVVLEVTGIVVSRRIVRTSLS